MFPISGHLLLNLLTKLLPLPHFSGFRCACFHVFGKVVRHYWIPVCAEVCSTDGNLTKEAFDKSTFLMTNFQCSKWWLCSPFLSKFLAAPPIFYSISLLFQALIFLFIVNIQEPTYHTQHLERICRCQALTHAAETSAWWTTAEGSSSPRI